MNAHSRFDHLLYRKALAWNPSVSWNNNVFNIFLNFSFFSSIRISSGSAFHSLGAKYSYALLPYFVFANEILSFRKSSGRQLWLLKSSIIFFEQIPRILLNTINRILYMILDSTRSQCKFSMSFEIGCLRFFCTTSLAAAFCTFWSLFKLDLPML